jgi:pimeloyl-ACP methyl ester carboxylesterase
VILVDARGHGDSDKLHDPAAYPLETRAADVVAVFGALDIVRSHYWGYSMGGWIGFGMAKFAPERIDRLVIGGQHPYARSSEGLRQMVRTGIVDGNDAFVAAAEEMGVQGDARDQGALGPRRPSGLSRDGAGPAEPRSNATGNADSVLSL